MGYTDISKCRFNRDHVYLLKLNARIKKYINNLSLPFSYDNRKQNIKNNKINNQDEAMKLLKEVNQKLDYIVKLLREEEYKYPFHNNYLDTLQNKDPKNL